MNKKNEIKFIETKEIQAPIEKESKTKNKYLMIKCIGMDDKEYRLYTSLEVPNILVLELQKDRIPYIELTNRQGNIVTQDKKGNNKIVS